MICAALTSFGEPKKGDKAVTQKKMNLLPHRRRRGRRSLRGRRSTPDYKKWMIAYL